MWEYLLFLIIYKQINISNLVIVIGIREEAYPKRYPLKREQSQDDCILKNKLLGGMKDVKIIYV